MKKTETLKLIDEICEEQGIEETFLSFGWIRELKKDGKIVHIVGNAFDLNPASSYDIVNDKYATYEVLANNNINVIKHFMIFNPNGRAEFAKDLEIEVDNILSEINGKAVVKANTSSEGKEVFLVNSKEETIHIIKELFKRNFLSVSICPYIEIEAEYRVIYLDGEILYVYKKEKPYVIGDGISSIRKLTSSFEENAIDSKLDFNYIPKEKEKVIINWKHNLYNGAKIETNLENDLKLEEVKDLARKAGQATNIKFATIDISKKADGDIFVMEINGSVCMSKFIEQAKNGKAIAKKIYEKAIAKMF